MTVPNSSPSEALIFRATLTLGVRVRHQLFDYQSNHSESRSGSFILGFAVFVGLSTTGTEPHSRNPHREHPRTGLVRTTELYHRCVLRGAIICTFRSFHGAFSASRRMHSITSSPPLHTVVQQIILSTSPMLLTAVRQDHLSRLRLRCFQSSVAPRPTSLPEFDTIYCVYISAGVR